MWVALCQETPPYLPMRVGIAPRRAGFLASSSTQMGRPRHPIPSQTSLRVPRFPPAKLEEG